MDYRNCSYEKTHSKDIQTEKNQLGQLIDSRVHDNKNVGLHYDKIKSKGTIYYRTFENIYGEKCAYCGMITSIQPTAMFEIDHFVNKKQETLSSGKSVDHIDNLVFACNKCNQSKKEFDVTAQGLLCRECIHPDKEVLPNVFERTDKYAIVIRHEYKNCKQISRFYKKLDFENRLRKLDFLLLNLYYYQLSSSERDCDKAAKVYIKLLSMRNRYV